MSKYLLNILKYKLTNAPIMVALDWNLPIEIMCDANDYVVSAIVRQRKGKNFQPIHYVSKTLNIHQKNYITTHKELLAFYVLIIML